MQEHIIPSWNLSDLFSGIDDPKINEWLQQANKDAENFESTYRQPLSDKSIDATTLKQAFDAYEAILAVAYKITGYAQLLFSSDTSNQQYGAFMQRMSEEASKLSQKILFFELGIIQLPQETLQSFMQEPTLAIRHYYLQKLVKQKPHVLSEAEEKILNKKSLTSNEAFSRLFDEENSALKIFIEGKSEPVNETTALKDLYHPNREVRKRASAGFSKTLQENERRFSFIYNTLILDKKIEDELRHFDNPETSRHLANQTNQAAVDALSKATQSHVALAQRYYQFKKKRLNLDTLHEYDRYAPLPENKQKHYTFEEAKDIILTAFSSFDTTFGETAKLFFDNGWIDAAERPSKRSGAYCMFMTPDHHPYVFMNYSGQARDVMTLAHELGHGVHAYLAKQQTLLDYSAPLTLCETASIFGEMLVFDYLKQQTTSNEEKLSLNMQKLEEIFASTFRQIYMYLFEQKVHQLSKKQGEIPSETLRSLWMETQREMFGESVMLTNDYSYWWSYISHFFQAPFYVYAYAFGELLTLSLYETYKQKGSSITKNYLVFLTAGGSKEPEELAKLLGFDLNNPTFWDNGFRMIETLIEETERL